MQIRRVSVSLAVLALALAACATREGRIREQQDLFDGYPARVQQLIREGRVAPGFTPDMVLIALGDPDERSVLVREKGDTHVWGYVRSRPSIGIGIGGGGSSMGGGLRMGSGGGVDYTAIVHFEKGRVSEARFFERPE